MIITSNKISENIHARALPTLPTSTTTSSSAPTTTTTSLSGSLSGTSSGITAGTSSLPSSITTPTIIPPSAANNPYIWHSPDVNGTVFIAVGAIIGAVFLIRLIWWSFSSYKSHRLAKQSMYSEIDNSFRGHNHQTTLNKRSIYQVDEGLNGTFVSTNRLMNVDNNNNCRDSRVSILDNNESFNMYGMDYSDEENEHVGFNPIQDNIPSYHNRQSLFISPTREVVEQQHKRKSRMLNNVGSNPFVTMIPPGSNNYIRPERSASPERRNKSPIRQHHKNNSSLNLAHLDFKDNLNNSNLDLTEIKNSKKQTPSTLLNDMLLEDL